jgi:hypothetical protein
MDRGGDGRTGELTRIWVTTLLCIQEAGIVSLMDE